MCVYKLYVWYIFFLDIKISLFFYLTLNKWEETQ